MSARFLAGPHSMISFVLAWMFISLQIKEFRTMGFFISDYSVFFFLTGLHFFHVLVGMVFLGFTAPPWPWTARIGWPWTANLGAGLEEIIATLRHQHYSDG